MINENSVIKNNNSKTLVIFDLDMTLVITDAKIKVVDHKSGKIIKTLTPEEYNTYENKPNYVLDFTDFDNPEILRQGKLIHNIFRKLRKYYQRRIPVAILTARSSASLVRNFILSQGIDIHKDLVIAVSDPRSKYTGSIEQRKKEAIIDLIDKGFNYLVFFDDHGKNLEEAKSIEKERKDVTIKTVKV